MVLFGLFLWLISLSLLAYVDWRIALGVFLAAWALKIDISLQRK